MASYFRGKKFDPKSVTLGQAELRVKRSSIQGKSTPAFLERFSEEKILVGEEHSEHPYLFSMVLLSSFRQQHVKTKTFWSISRE